MSSNKVTEQYGSVRISREVYEQVKMIAVLKNTSAKAIVEDALALWLEKNAAEIEALKASRR